MSHNKFNTFKMKISENKIIKHRNRATADKLLQQKTHNKPSYTVTVLNDCPI